MITVSYSCPVLIMYLLFQLELILSIKSKLDDLDNMKGLLDVEMKENESLGKQVCNITKNVCTPKEQEKYNIFVQDVDKIINLLLSLSGRLARVENAIQMLPADAEKQEMVNIFDFFIVCLKLLPCSKFFKKIILGVNYWIFYYAFPSSLLLFCV